MALAAPVCLSNAKNAGGGVTGQAESGPVANSALRLQPLGVR